ncbi:MAG: extracellular solute-binding protein [Firmicutes bacterium]|jgi:raffinose/stachyose/melibiose transport system substrate-binding protein|nr:extracellular solute-binding protein [Bacillota bacterium]MDH7494675.1 extracellular solute-binding protein [Bacillota bacterium]
MFSGKRKTLVMLVCVLVACAVTGGLGGNVSVAADKPIVLRVLNYMDATSPSAYREITEVWEAFEKNNPDIKIEREDLFNEPFHQKTEAYAAAGQLPDVMYMWPGGRSSTLHTKRLVKDLAPLLGEMRKEFSEAALVPQAGGYLAELPIGVTATHVLYVNAKMLREMGLALPKTYDELKAMVPKLKAAGKDVILMGAQDDWVMQSCFFSMIAGRLCGDKFIDDVLAGKAKFTDAPFVKALKFYESLYADGVLSRKILQTPYNEVNGLFASGKAPFMIDGDWKVSNFLTDPSTGRALIPPAEQRDYVMTVFPQIPGEINHSTTSSVPGVGFGMNAEIPAGSEKEKAAWKLIMWLTSPEVQRIRLETGAAFPSRKGVTSDKLEPLAQERAQFYGRFSGTYVLDNALHAQVYGPLNVGLQEIGLGISTPEQVAAKVQRALESWRATQK